MLDVKLLTTPQNMGSSPAHRVRCVYTHDLFSDFKCDVKSVMSLNVRFDVSNILIFKDIKSFQSCLIHLTVVLGVPHGAIIKTFSDTIFATKTISA